MHDTPIRTQQLALRNAYAAGDPLRCAAHHLNLARQMEAAGGEPSTYLAHCTAGAVLLFQSGGDLLPDSLGQLAMSFVQHAPRRPPLPDDIDALAAIQAAMCPADVNYDDAINVVDIGLMTAQWNLSLGDAGYNPRRDLDFDNTISVSDLVAVANQWQTTCTGS